MSEYKLYCVGESGNCYKVALMLNVCGCDWQPVFVDYFGGETRGETYRDSLNELGEVPVLEHEGRRLTQSGAILTWLADRLGRYGGRDEHERLEVLRWMLFDNHKFTSYYATLRFLKGIVKSGDPAVLEFLRGRALGAFAHRRQAPGEAAVPARRGTDHRRLLADRLPVLRRRDRHRPRRASRTSSPGPGALRSSRDGSILTS